ncbi:tyrosine-type recombinase/integrase [bacterium]|nr:tyrosine-type recombinase/integrase [bacterium]
MKSLKEAAEEYIYLRRALGFKLRDTESLLKDFTDFMERENAPYITTNLSLLWAKAPKNALQAYWSSRLSVIRRFAQYVKAMDSRNEVPPHGILPYRYHRCNPYIYSDEEVLKLLQACNSLNSGNELRKHTCYTVLGLLAVTGMRISEVTALTRENVDLTQGIISIRNTKSRKSRLIPVHRSTLQVLREYARLRNQIYPTCQVSNFFLSDQGTVLTGYAVRYVFIHLSHQIGLRKPTDSHGPRIHDLRHRFAVKTIIKWYREGVNVENLIPLLSTYLGHTKPSDTYWYLSSVPELIGLAAARLEKHLGGLR